jgi:nucleoside 2-deoxyribosyltransferase
MKLSIYLAARFTRKEEMAAKRRELEALGFHVTSRWVYEPSAPDSKLSDVSTPYKVAVAMDDIADIDDADVMIFFAEDPLIGTPRGGRHFESGYAYGTKKLLIVVGEHENIFHYLPGVKNVQTWESAKLLLLANETLWKSQADGHSGN